MDHDLQPRTLLGCELVVDVAHNFGEVSLRVTGASMVPALWPGDVITIRRRDIAELQPGQIVLSRRQRELVAHRIVWIRGDSVITRGDSLLLDDPPVNAFNIVGEVVSIDRHGRPLRPKQSFSQRTGSFILRRSGLCLRMTLRLGLRIRRWMSGEYSWAS